MQACRICNNSEGNKIHNAREMLFGMRDEFEYLECVQCGCVQILKIPDNLSKYYPSDYHPFDDIKDIYDSFIKSRLKIQVSKYCLHGKKYIIGCMLSHMYNYAFLT